MKNSSNKIILAITGRQRSDICKEADGEAGEPEKAAGGDRCCVFGQRQDDMGARNGGKFTAKGHAKEYSNKDFFVPFASGSSDFDTMIICPASMGILGRIASGTSDDLIARGADVMLKERRKLILVPRETPYNLIHIRNMETLTLAGAIICPASPSFYSKPASIDELVMTVVERVISLAGF